MSTNGQEFERELHPSEVALNQAETKFQLAQARKEVALARKEEAQAEIHVIALDRERDKRSRELAADDRHHVYRFAGGVTSDTATKCVAQLEFWSRTEPGCEIEIEFFSPGGNVFAGMQLFDKILSLRAAGHHITTSTHGYAASMAGILLQSGDKRVIGKESYLHIHEISAGAIGKLAEIEDEVDFMKLIEKRVVKIYAERSKMSEGQIRRKMKRKEWWMDSAEALKVGFVDEVR